MVCIGSTRNWKLAAELDFLLNYFLILLAKNLSPVAVVTVTVTVVVVVVAKIHKSDYAVHPFDSIQTNISGNDCGSLYHCYRRLWMSWISSFTSLPDHRVEFRYEFIRETFYPSHIIPLRWEKSTSIISTSGYFFFLSFNRISLRNRMYHHHFDSNFLKLENKFVVNGSDFLQAFWTRHFVFFKSDFRDPKKTFIRNQFSLESVHPFSTSIVLTFILFFENFVIRIIRKLLNR